MTPSRLGLLPKILLIQAAVLVLAGLLVPLAVDALLEARTGFYERKVLAGQARAVADALRADEDGRIRLTPGGVDREGVRREFGFSVVDAGGVVLLSTTRFAAGVLNSVPRSAAAVFDELEADGRHYAVTSLPVVLAGRPAWVLLGWDLDADDVIFDDVRRGFLPVAIAVAVPLLALLLGANILVVRRFFRPVLRVADQVRALDPVRTDARLPAQGLPPEIRPLAAAFNGALDRVERGARVQKEFTADAAHELRTPLAVLHARLQTLPATPLRAELLADTDRMARIVRQLLDLAHLERDDGAADTADLLAVCTAVVSELAPEAIVRGQELGLDVPAGLQALPVAVREQDAWHMLRNLVENAIRHTPPGTAITVELEAPGRPAAMPPMAVLKVRDDGPGIPAALHDKVFQRFWRSSRNDGAGAGLGLAIVRRVAEAKGGTVGLRSAEGQGTEFVVSLPFSVTPAAGAGTGPGRGIAHGRAP